MLFVKNMVFLDGAIATLAPDLDIFAEIANISMLLRRDARRAARRELGIDHTQAYELDLDRREGQLRRSTPVDRAPDLPRAPAAPRAHPQAHARAADRSADPHRYRRSAGAPRHRPLLGRLRRAASPPTCPMATRLIMVKADGCVAIHADGGAYKPLNWMNAPNTPASRSDGRWIVTNPKGERSPSRSRRSCATQPTTSASTPACRRTASRPTSRSCWPPTPPRLGDGLTLVRREYPTDIGPVDLLCRDADGAAVAVEIKRRGEIDGVEQLTRYLEFLDRDPLLRAGARHVRRPGRSSPRPRCWPSRPRHRAASRSTTTSSAASSRDDLRLF